MKKKWQKLDYIFHPRSIAIIGASANPIAKGYDYLKGHLEFEFPGEIYPVNPQASELFGLKTYPTIRDIPGRVDYVMSAIPAKPTVEIIDDCAAKGAKVIQIFAAGFSETGEEEGIKLEAELLSRARHGGIRIIGPNGIGLHYPKGRIAFARARFSREGGPVGCLIQSGGHAWNMVSSGSIRGIRFSKLISFGNACDLNETDFLEYLVGDPETEIVVGYIEGVKDGFRFLEVLKEADKPVIIFKGGRSESGMRAAASHTGSLAGQDSTWEALFQQTGAIRVYSLEELIDVALAFMYTPKIAGRNVAIIGVGGGASVQAADECESAGLSVPLLPREMQEELKTITPPEGSSFPNPVDTQGLWRPAEFSRTIELIAAWDEVDMLLFHVLVELHAQFKGRSALDSIVDTLTLAAKRVKKPMAVVLQTFGSPPGMSKLYELQKGFIEVGLPAYPSVARAANAMSKVLSWGMG